MDPGLQNWLFVEIYPIQKPDKWCRMKDKGLRTSLESVYFSQHGGLLCASHLSERYILNAQADNRLSPAFTGLRLDPTSFKRWMNKPTGQEYLVAFNKQSETMQEFSHFSSQTCVYIHIHVATLVSVLLILLGIKSCAQKPAAFPIASKYRQSNTFFMDSTMAWTSSSVLYVLF